MMAGRRWLLATAALPLLSLPFVVREVIGQEKSAPAPADPPSAPSPPPAATPPPPSEAAAPGQDDAPAAEESVSADNNLSFPVDI
jgi:hypothetical protein